MSKSAEAFRTISEVADDLGVPKHVLRFWEVKFNQIRPMKRGGGRRYYRPEDMELLKGILHLLHREGYTIKGVQKILREQGVDVVKARAHVSLAADEPASPALVSAPDGGAPPSSRNSDAVPPLRVAPSRRVHVRGAAQQARRSTLIRAAIAELEACRAILIGEPAPQPDRLPLARTAGGR